MRYRSGVMEPDFTSSGMGVDRYILFLFFGRLHEACPVFFRKIKRELSGLKEITDKIAENDLEFTAVSSGIDEVNEVVASLAHLKEALQESLETVGHGTGENVRLRALSHDIKTPLTIIRKCGIDGGRKRFPENKKWNKTILENTGQIESYLTAMRNVLKEENDAEELISVSADSLQQMLCTGKANGGGENIFRSKSYRMGGSLSNGGEIPDPKSTDFAGMGKSGRQCAGVYRSDARYHPGGSRGTGNDSKSGACSLQFCVIDYGKWIFPKRSAKRTQESLPD